MTRSLFVALLVLPGTVLLFVPGVLLWAFAGTPLAHAPKGAFSLLFAFSFALLGCGLLMAISTVRVFVHHGNGTPAPWAPPRSLVVRGPYRYVRNPMITGIFLLLAAEALLLGSWPLVGWLLTFAALNLVYIPFVEEPDLVRRFGDSYREYCAHVPRWVPRLSPWQAADLQA